MQLYDVLARFNNQLGEVERYKNLALVRIFGDDIFRDEVLVLDEALKTGQFTVSEATPMQVNALEARSTLEKIVFIAGGMTVEGDTQNRAVQFPSLVPARSRTALSVRCVERGQPTREGTRFKSSTTIVTASARTGDVSQQRTWGTVSLSRQSVGAQTKTDDYVSVAQSAGLDDYLQAFGKAQPSQLGYLAAIRNNGEVFFYSDLFGNNALYGKLHDRLVHSVAMTARSVASPQELSIDKDRFLEFLTEASSAQLQQQKSLEGASGNLYLAEQPVAGTALLYLEAPVQVSLRKDHTQEHYGVENSRQTRMFQPVRR